MASAAAVASGENETPLTGLSLTASATSLLIAGVTVPNPGRSEPALMERICSTRPFLAARDSMKRSPASRRTSSFMKSLPTVLPSSTVLKSQGFKSPTLAPLLRASELGRHAGPLDLLGHLQVPPSLDSRARRSKIRWATGTRAAVPRPRRRWRSRGAGLPCRTRPGPAWRAGRRREDLVLGRIDGQGQPDGRLHPPVLTCWAWVCGARCQPRPVLAQDRSSATFRPRC